MSIVGPLPRRTRACSICSPAPARSASRRCRAARRPPTSSRSRRRAFARSARTSRCSAPADAHPRPSRAMRSASSSGLDAGAYDVAFADPPYDLGMARRDRASAGSPCPSPRSSASSIAATRSCRATATRAATARRRSPSIAATERASSLAAIAFLDPPMSILPDVPNSRIAIYAGSFDPITRGHEDLMRRSLEFVDRLDRRGRDERRQAAAVHDRRARRASFAPRWRTSRAIEVRSVRRTARRFRARASAPAC